MKRVGITGVNGFLGTHLSNEIKYCHNNSKFYLVDSSRLNLMDRNQIKHFALKCDVIIHLAGVLRSNSDSKIYDENLKLSTNLIDVLYELELTPQVIFASSIHEERNSSYGRAKKAARVEWEDWAKKTGANFSGLIIPNVFGPFAKPYYSSVVATFCHQLTINEIPKVLVDAELPLVYVDNLIKQIIKIIDDHIPDSIIKIKPDFNLKVSQLLDTLCSIKSLYIEDRAIPDIKDPNILNLFNTFRSYIDTSNYFPVYYDSEYQKQHNSLIPFFGVNSKTQISFITINPGLSRGNYFQKRRVERLALLKGRLLVNIRKVDSDQIISFTLEASRLSYIDIPIWHTYEVINVGDKESLLILFSSEHSDQYNLDSHSLKTLV